MKHMIIVLMAVGFLSLTAYAMAKHHHHKELKVGDTAPNFTLCNEKGEKITFYDIKGKKALVFYPKDGSLSIGCKKQLCGLKNSYSDLTAKGITVLGINNDSVSSHKSFKDKQNFPFMLLSDPDNKVCEMYGTEGWFGPKRVTYLINETKIVGIIKHPRLKDHTEEILEAFETSKS